MNPVSKLLSLPELADYDPDQKRRLLLKWWEWRWQRFGNLAIEVVAALSIYALLFTLCERVRAWVFATFNPLSLFSAVSALVSVWAAWVIVVHLFYLPRHSELKKIRRKLPDCRPKGARDSDHPFGGVFPVQACSYENIELPADYVACFDRSETGGARTKPVDRDGFSIWSPEEVDEMNEKLDMARAAPGFLVFGSSGSGELAAFDRCGAVYAIPMVDQEISCARKLADSWQAFSSCT